MIKLSKNVIGEFEPCYIIAEMSANHAGDFNRAIEIIHAAKDAGANCIKIQTYTPETMTIDCSNEHFMISKGTWKGENLYNLYSKAYTPWEWQAEIKKEVESVGLDFLSTPFDSTSVDFLEELGVDFYKIASFEITDIPLLKYVARKAKPILLSTGMSNIGEIERAINTIKAEGNEQIVLLRCSSAYPTIPDDMNLASIVTLKNTFGLSVGLSDHSLGSIGALVAVSLGAKVIEKHFCISREIENPDASFSMEAEEFKQMVDEIRKVEKAIGVPKFGVSVAEIDSLIFRRSIFVVQDIVKGDFFTTENTRVIRPGVGLEPMHYENVLGCKARRNIVKGTPLKWSDVE